MRRLVPTTAVIVVLLILGMLTLEQRGTAVATLVVSEGQATVQQSRTQFGFWQRETAVTLSTGDVLIVYQGDRVVVAQNAAARLNLQDGSVVELEAGTTLALTELVITDMDYRVQLQLVTGKMVNRVTRLLGTDDYFRVSTPSSTASVRGTVFTVEVLSETATFVAVDEGTVQVQMAGQAVAVQAGEMVTAVVGQPLQVQPQSNVLPTSQPIPSAIPTATTSSPIRATSVISEVLPSTAVLPTATPLTTRPTIKFPTGTLPPFLPTTIRPTAVNTPPIVGNPLPTVVNTPPFGTPLPTAVLPTVTATSRPPTLTPWLPTATFTPPVIHATPTLAATVTAVNPTATTQPTAVPSATATPAPTETPLPIPTATMPPEPTATAELVTLCHIPPGNPDNRHTIHVPPSDVQAHLDHGDYLGPCE